MKALAARLRAALAENPAFTAKPVCMRCRMQKAPAQFVPDLAVCWSCHAATPGHWNGIDRRDMPRE